jgi:hypothetical protein
VDKEMTPTRNVTVTSSLISARTVQREISLESRTEGLQRDESFQSSRLSGKSASDDFGGFYNGARRKYGMKFLIEKK